jgi:hypothetical protein
VVSYGLLDNLEKGMIRVGDSQQPQHNRWDLGETVRLVTRVEHLPIRAVFDILLDLC